MSNITLDLDGNKFISFYQDDVSGQVEILPIYNEGMMIGDPVLIDTAEELIDVLTACLKGDFAVFENQYVFDFDPIANDDWPIDGGDKA